MFPALYQLHHSKYREDLPFWLELASQANGLILELGCGTGRVLVPLAQAGYHILGLDNDFAMLHFTAGRLPLELKTQIGLFQADMGRFHLSSRMGAIFLPCNTLSTLEQPALQELFSCVSAHLREGGIFAASLPNPEFLASLPPFGEAEIEDYFPHPGDGEPVQVSSSWQRLGSQFTVTWSYDHLLPDGRVKRHQVIVRHLLHPLDFYYDSLRAAGFKTVHRYGDFTKRALQKTSPTFIFSAIYQPS
jgi:SAM-dependent methyltransferase